ncbi:MAG: DUF3592 domain-containing protein [Phycisphaerales bacterium]|nr:DUF3592 domain-containing protein [Phycisphaerales bacterium]
MPEGAEASFERKSRPALLVLAAGLLMAGGLAMMGLGGLWVWEAEASRGWPQASGAVLESRLVEESIDRHVAVVVYEYVVDGSRHQGRRVRHGDDWWTQSTCDARADVSRYPAGRPVRVRYKPASPGESVLEPGAGAGVWGLVVAGAVLFAIGALWLAGPSRRGWRWGFIWSDDGGGDGGDCGGDGGDGD